VREVIKNEFDIVPGAAAVDKIDRKYLRYVQEFQGTAFEDAFNAFRTKDIGQIEQALKNLADSQNTALFLIGLGAMIIEREKLFIKAGYVSYIEYTQHLFEEYDIPISTVSDYKIIMERYIDNYKPLSKAGFRLLRNANKLRYLDEALANHEAAEVFGRIIGLTQELKAASFLLTA
jgi:ribosomal protein S8